jgi:hypothetical protein
LGPDDRAVRHFGLIALGRTVRDDKHAAVVDVRRTSPQEPAATLAATDKCLAQSNKSAPASDPYVVGDKRRANGAKPQPVSHHQKARGTLNARSGAYSQLFGFKSQDVIASSVARKGDFPLLPQAAPEIKCGLH